jgi:hypothetical protein
LSGMGLGVLLPQFCMARGLLIEHINVRTPPLRLCSHAQLSARLQLLPRGCS